MTDPAEHRESSAGWLVQRLARRFEEAMCRALEPEGLTLAQFAILRTVLEMDGLTQAAIGARFAMPAWEISRGLDALEGLGLVQRRACPLSRRAHRIHATAAGLARATRLQLLVEGVNAEVLAPLDTGQRAALVALLGSVILPAGRR